MLGGAVDARVIKVGKEGSRRGMSRRAIIVVAAVTSMTIVFVVATSLAPVSKLTIRVANIGDDDVVVFVWVDDHNARTELLGPLESVSFSWNITGWLHKFDVGALGRNVLANDLSIAFLHTWTYIVVLPFCEKIITNEV